MSYGVTVSLDSFVLTKNGPISLRFLSKKSEILGVEGIGKRTKYQQVELRKEKKANGFRLFTQTTDSIIAPGILIFSERVCRAENLLSYSQIEYFNPSQSVPFETTRQKESCDLQPDAAYAAGLLSETKLSNTKHIVFLLRDGNNPEYLEHIKSCVGRLIEPIVKNVSIRLHTGKIGYIWIILKGDGVDKIRKHLSNMEPEKVCLRMDSKLLKWFVAGMLDTYVCKSYFGGVPVLTFSEQNSLGKRFLHNILLFYNARIIETSCLTSYAPKLLELTTIIGNNIPIRNPLWEELSANQTSLGIPKLFSRVRGWINIETSIANLLFEEQGFSPIIDGLYTHPSNLLQ